MIGTEQLVGLGQPLHQHQHASTFFSSLDAAAGLQRQLACNNTYTVPVIQASSQPLQATQVFNTLPAYANLPVLTGIMPMEPCSYGSPQSSFSRVVSSSPVYLAPPEQRSVFFAGVTPVVTTETLMALFSQFGRVLDLNLFKPWAGSKTSKGCGLVVFEDRTQAAAALEALNGRFQWPGARGPMVVEWMDANKQHKKARAQPLMQPLLQHQFMAMQSRLTANMVPAQVCIINQAQPVPFLF